ncbi:hypothetical protein HMPREF9519_00716 [Enterococcus faecalis TX1346]|nr:hypothetical protein HMPREF9519_00716 [Enterococcus faecalis TX1346]
MSLFETRCLLGIDTLKHTVAKRCLTMFSLLKIKRMKTEKVPLVRWNRKSVKWSEREKGKEGWL